MVHPISPLGVVHTVIGLVPIVAALYGFVRYRKIDPEMPSGKIYLIGTVLSVITSFGVSSTGGLNAGHAFGVVVLLVAFAGALAHKLRFMGSLRSYLSVFGLSFSFLLSLVPATNETLTRLPPSHPLAAAPLSPLVMHVLITWVGIFIVGFSVQCWLVYSGNRGVSRI